MMPINLRPTPRELRFFGAGLVVVLGAIGIALWRRPGLAAAVPWLALAPAAAVTLLRPTWLRWPFIAMTVLTWPIGVAVSWVVLGALFYAVIAPIGRVRRWAGHDAMCRSRQRETSRYWVRRPPPRDATAYFRQY